jgi:hypothetical protein
MTESLELHSEARGSHWVAWAARPGEAKPYDGALVVGRTREESEERLKERLARLTG